MNNNKLFMALVIIVLMSFVVYPVALEQINLMNANTQIKSEKRCEQYKEAYIDMMAKKLNTTLLLEKAKQDNCRK